MLMGALQERADRSVGTPVAVQRRYAGQGQAVRPVSHPLREIGQAILAIITVMAMSLAVLLSLSLVATHSESAAVPTSPTPVGG